MNKEIERKFLVIGKSYRKEASKVLEIQQGYISETKRTITRVRIENHEAYLTIKENKKEISKLEFEYSIPIKDGNYLIDNLCNNQTISKTRYIVNFESCRWEIDEFGGDNEGLVIAEIELEDEDQHFEKPYWIKSEVTEDSRYYNVNLIKNPFKN